MDIKVNQWCRFKAKTIYDLNNEKVFIEKIKFIPSKSNKLVTQNASVHYDDIIDHKDNLEDLLKVGDCYWYTIKDELFIEKQFIKDENNLRFVKEWHKTYTNSKMPITLHIIPYENLQWQSIELHENRVKQEVKDE